MPENTLPAFLYALELGVDALEMDVVLAADGEVVVSHEPWLSSLCRDARGRAVEAGAERQHNLYRMSYAEIRRCDCGLTPHPGFPRQQSIAAYKPLLRDVIRAVEQRVQELNRPAIRFSIEIKSCPEDDDLFHPKPAPFVAQVLAVLAEEQILGRSTLLSFDKRILREGRRQAPALPVCLLVEDEVPCAEHVAALGFRPEVYGPQYRLVTAELVADLHAQGIRLVPWTVNATGAMLALWQLGVDGLTTDYPDRLRDVLNSSRG
ncbi:glycerophosphodiester phosphodiesterase family protein [Hymenobacter fastidiosus]|uniref:Glycerophosphodiester phosphodiesterase family protein n=1 Tax=Hymenobacter fastidiosus TaxID=486264 RepID=A0ABP7T120_9BACT